MRLRDGFWMMINDRMDGWINQWISGGGLVGRIIGWRDRLGDEMINRLIVYRMFFENGKLH